MNTLTTKHTPGAIRAAEIITSGKYGEDRKYPTDYGLKTVEEIADLIERETRTPKLLEACIQARAALPDAWHAVGKFADCAPVVELLNTVITSVTGEV